MTNALPTITFDATEHSLKARLVLPTKADAEALRDQFPKSTKVLATTLSRPANDGTSYFNANGEYASETVGILAFDAKLSPDGIRGERNETGLKRWASFKRHAARLGYAVEYRPTFTNSLPPEQAEAL